VEQDPAEDVACAQTPFTVMIAAVEGTAALVSEGGAGALDCLGADCGADDFAGGRVAGLGAVWALPATATTIAKANKNRVI